MECPICKRNTEQKAEGRGPDWYFCPDCQFSFHVGKDGEIQGSVPLTDEAQKKLEELLKERTRGSFLPGE